MLRFSAASQTEEQSNEHKNVCRPLANSRLINLRSRSILGSCRKWPIVFFRAVNGLNRRIHDGGSRLCYVLQQFTRAQEADEINFLPASLCLCRRRKIRDSFCINAQISSRRIAFHAPPLSYWRQVASGPVVNDIVAVGASMHRVDVNFLLRKYTLRAVPSKEPHLNDVCNTGLFKPSGITQTPLIFLIHGAILKSFNVVRAHMVRFDIMYHDLW